MKSLMQLWSKVLYELGTWFGTDTTLDLKTARSRFEHEGLSFLTITLSNFGSDFQKSLDQGRIADDSFAGFSRMGGLPRFLGGFLQLVFDRESGKLLDIPESDAIFAVRQLTLMCSKVSIPCSESREKRALNGYLKCENEVKAADRERTAADYRMFSRVSMLLCANAFSSVDFNVKELQLRPKHGPGATADRLRGNSKYRQRVWHQRLETAFPALEFLFPNARYWQNLEGVNFIEPGAEPPVRVVLVPKTLKTPRVIAIEPTCMQYTQQALLENLLEAIERDDLLSHFLGFDDQTPNQEMARIGSSDGSLATLDLSEASDRVSNQLVRTLLQRFPHFAEAVDACRSRKADVPGHGVIRLAKFASMGSALCFPFEAVVFLTIVFGAIEKELNLPLTRKLVHSFVGQVRIYGDDIIVPRRFVPGVIRELENFGFRVNADKSFWTGRFRESCGKEFFEGDDVSIVKVRELLPTTRQHVGGIISTVSLRNQLYQLGLWQTCQWIDGILENVLQGHYPVVLSTSPVLGRHSVLGYEVQKEHPYLHSPLVRGYVVRSRLPVSPLDGEDALLKYFLKRGFEPLDERHLERAGRPDAVNLKLRWAAST